MECARSEWVSGRANLDYISSEIMNMFILGISYVHYFLINISCAQKEVPFPHVMPNAEMRLPATDAST